MPDNEVKDSSEADVLLVKPKKILIYFLAMIACFGILFFWILIAKLFKSKVRADEDIKKITDIPINEPYAIQYVEKKYCCV